jgi:tyrosinase
MTDPDTAGLDPIFWLHHANIDRLWEVWNELPTATGNPTQSKWVNGPASVGQHAFVLPMPDGTDLTYTPSGMASLAALGYAYDDVSPPSVAPQVVARLERLGVGRTRAVDLSKAMADSKNVELLGANSGSLRLTGKEAQTSVTLESTVRRKVTSSLRSPGAEAATVPDRVFLNLENVRGVNDATAFSVYINVPAGEDPAKHPELKAGSVALFGVRKASQKDDKHSGDGLTFVLEITDIVDRLHLTGDLNADKLHVRLVPRNEVPDEAQISIGRVSVFRQSP